MERRHDGRVAQRAVPLALRQVAVSDVPVLGHNIPPYPVSRLALSVQSITQLETEVRFWP